MRRCVIVGGAEIRTYDRVRQYFRPDDFFIYCDCGLRHQKALGAEPDLIVGDFDSHEKPETDRETIVLPVKKDDTDTVFAAKEAMRRGFDEFLLVGVSGGRLDHTLVNVYLLVMLREQGKRALLVDDYSEMELVGAEKVEIPERFHRHRPGHHGDRLQVPAGQRGNSLRLPVRHQQRGAAGTDRCGLREGGTAAAHQGFPGGVARLIVFTPYIRKQAESVAFSLFCLPLPMRHSS